METNMSNSDTICDVLALLLMSNAENKKWTFTRYVHVLDMPAAFKFLISYRKEFTECQNWFQSWFFIWKTVNILTQNPLIGWFTIVSGVLISIVLGIALVIGVFIVTVGVVCLRRYEFFLFFCLWVWCWDVFFCLWMWCWRRFFANYMRNVTSVSRPLRAGIRILIHRFVVCMFVVCRL